MVDESARAEKVMDAKDKGINFVKSRAFDFVAVGIVVAMFALTLGVLELREITAKEILDIFFEALPFYFAVTLLSLNYYHKGSFSGKLSQNYIMTVKAYSNRANKLTGKQIGVLSQFCNEYNDKTIVNKQTSILRTAVLTYEDFVSDYVTKHESHGEVHYESHGPLCNMGKLELIHLLGKNTAKVVIKAQKVKIKGLRVNTLLGNFDTDDDTDIGFTESQLAINRTRNYAIGAFFFIILLTLIAVKDIMEWGWGGAIYAVFKVLIVVCRGYMRFFEGYEDITVNLVNHISRKTDILKEFENWYIDKFGTEKSTEVISEEVQ